jgi:ComF family protein
MCEALAERASRPDAILPIPLHRARLARRGYNQALELARPIASLLGLAVLPRALVRTRDTAPQTELDADARRRNLRGAFTAEADAIAGRRVLLVDDVVTTGATVREAAATLIRAGAASVAVAAAARAPH